ncbi:TetR/AcrR family transcriptional regulator [Oricola thermophila]|uniref:TetR/AcrR family transcriptional regulator n=2 Tax=Oricola thermophila TaxID=2742145 RepID=A0A6N1VHW2_9HYPH|nr:TetR/AcrR family transcriptional regulator [Oricola thermophila]
MARAGTSREKILKAAAELAMCEGAAHLSLDAVAARAGVSKGGLLYNFPNKTALMRALVEQFIEEFRAEIEDAPGTSDGEALAARFLELGTRKLREKTPRSSGVLAALAEDPGLLAPVKTFNRELLDRMKDDAADPGAILVAFMVMEGLRAQHVFGIDVLDDEERRLLMEKVFALLGKAPASAA